MTRGDKELYLRSRWGKLGRDGYYKVQADDRIGKGYVYTHGKKQQNGGLSYQSRGEEEGVWVDGYCVR